MGLFGISNMPSSAAVQSNSGTVLLKNYFYADWEMRMHFKTVGFVMPETGLK